VPSHGSDIVSSDCDTNTVIFCEPSLTGESLLREKDGEPTSTLRVHAPSSIASHWNLKMLHLGIGEGLSCNRLNTEIMDIEIGIEVCGLPEAQGNITVHVSEAENLGSFRDSLAINLHPMQ